ncbi:hypothetical protein KBTX_02803 [wastewater metagenome]|uniref:HNH nuclease domain-containing protein n=2 Tax=unclassified sequences TaxID=12908 RepID=A0A5B8RG30_9ZZZZ|nr:HNH endonuclease [Arhodomonas sp. KWT]QEA06464.1 hypothetical protein KBTEX_02803 [uncultured organism]
MSVETELARIGNDRITRHALVHIYTESLRYLLDRASRAVIVRFHGRHLRLMFARLVVLTLEGAECWITTDPACRSRLETLRSWQWDRQSYPRYRRPPSLNGYYDPNWDNGTEWAVIGHAHQRYLDEVMAGHANPDPRSLRHHRQDVADHLLAHAMRAPAGERPLPDMKPEPDSPEPAFAFNEVDTRIPVPATIVRRTGQPRFRETLIRVYTGRCAFSGCAVPQALEAAHIVPYRGRETDHVQNGLLLRRDLHALFDHGLIGVDERTMKILVDASLAHTEYAVFAGQPVLLPKRSADEPSKEALKAHRQRSSLNE